MENNNMNIKNVYYYLVTIICIVNSVFISQSFIGSIDYIAKKGIMMIITYEKCKRMES